jgi:hypothetical protein
MRLASCRAYANTYVPTELVPKSQSKIETGCQEGTKRNGCDQQLTTELAAELKRFRL